MNRPSFPMVARELTFLARAPHLYVLRTACVVLALLPLAAFQLTSAARAQAGVPVHMETLGGWLVWLCTYFHIFVFCLVVPLSTAGLIAAERRDRTLPLLMLADLRGWDVAASKFCAALLPPVYLILATLPLMAFAAFFGGISVQGVTLQIPFAIAVSLAAGCIGLLCSALTTTPQRAFAATITLLAVWMLGVDFAFRIVAGGFGSAVGSYLSAIVGLWVTLRTPFQSDVTPPYEFNPTAALWNFQETPLKALDCLPASILTMAIALGAAALAFIVIPYSVYERPERARRTSLVHRITRRLLPLRPGAHLLVSRSNAFAPAVRSNALRAIFFVALFGVAMIPGGFGWALILCVISFTTVTAVTMIRKNGLLEDLLVTPMETPDLAQDLVRAGLDRAAVYILPVALSGGLYIHSLIAQTNIGDAFTMDGLDTAADYVYWMGSYAVSAVLMSSLLTLQLFCIVSLASLAGSFRAPTPLMAFGVMALYGITFFFTCRFPLRLILARQPALVEPPGPFDDYLGVLGFSGLNILVFGGVGLLAYNELRDRIRTEFIASAEAPGKWTPHQYYRRGPIENAPIGGGFKRM